MAGECGVPAKCSLFNALWLYKLRYERITVGFPREADPIGIIDKMEFIIMIQLDNYDSWFNSIGKVTASVFSVEP